jgi:hydrogenase maturation protein HypF
MAVEFAAEATEEGTYPVDLVQGPPAPAGVDAAWQPAFELDWRPLVSAVLEDLRQGIAPGLIAARFHRGLVQAMVAVAREVGQARVALTGGCFGNRLLTESAHRALTAAGFEVLLHRQVPAGDGGLALGQVMVAAAQLAARQTS